MSPQSTDQSGVKQLAFNEDATFNINNVNRRLPNLLEWLHAAKLNVVRLQELKCTQKDFPLKAMVLAAANLRHAA
ncbi:MAG: exodeoxyribonuclease [Hyphomicrobiales bacterium]|jgi:exonuclease III|nr:exodeoxyribonuclease [Hyphomicrobiales bacterium]